MDENNKSQRASEAWEMVMSNITDDLWTEIFLRLPFESLLRFKSVSKTWLPRRRRGRPFLTLSSRSVSHFREFEFSLLARIQTNQVGCSIVEVAGESVEWELR
ncbi:hypothetical protein ACET3Z_029611 [Daucus carota]